MLLLDVNALIALVWPAHQHRAAVFTWFTRHAAMRAGGKLLSLDRGVHPLLATEEERRRHLLLLG